MTRSTGWETPWVVSPKDDTWFYHVMDLPGVGRTSGEWDLRDTIDDYLGPCPFAGLTVLDVGCASGYLTFALERKGASVVSFDLRDPRTEQKFVPYVAQRHRAEELVRSAEAFHRRLKGGYWLAHRLLKSSARVRYGNVYRLPVEFSDTFDVVLLGQVLVHLNDPVSALTAAAQVARDHLVVIEKVLPDQEPKALFLPDVEDGQHFAWWQCSLALYRNVLRILGFEIEHVGVSEHRCLAYEEPRQLQQLHTITAKRVMGTAEVAPKAA
jgi:2-polyprenyl-3-methyl-5-hydroxy-6-metoxy-1,4-benzoquinol methylase